MSALTDRIAAEHFVRSGAFYVTDQHWEDVCACGDRFPTGGIRAHIAAVTEAAVREHIAAALDDLARARHDDLKETKRRTRAETFAGASAMAYELAARIARGVTPMSTCISKHGEYSEHGPLTDGYWCEWCGALDEAAMRKGIESAVREQVAQDIREKRDRFDRDYLEEAAYDDAARIAEGVDL